jgi:hypothetical protein
MAEKKLPEINVGTGEMVDQAAELVKVRAQIAELETKAKTLTETVAGLATTLRNTKLDAGEVVGLIRITDERAPIQVQFKVSAKEAGKMVDTEEELDELFGPARPLLFGRDTIITSITDPEGLVQAMKDSGRNPWDFLAVVPKEGAVEVVSGYPQVISDTRLMPKTGFLATLTDIWKTLSADAHGYAKAFVKEVCKASVVVGSKGKGKVS